jgi:hypothetical protein
VTYLIYPTWDLLCASIPHRHERLRALLAEFDRQKLPWVRMRVFYDNLTVPVGAKYGRLIRDSHADYVSVFEDDDWPAPDFIARCSEALLDRPDYVGFRVKWTHNGQPASPIVHSLAYPGPGYNGADMLTRNINQFNPIKRELALLGDYQGHPPAGQAWDAWWADSMRATGQVKTEAFIDEPMYYYRTDSGDTFMTPRVPFPETEVPRVPSYPWLTVVTE